MTIEHKSKIDPIKIIREGRVRNPDAEPDYINQHPALSPLERKLYFFLADVTSLDPELSRQWDHIDLALRFEVGESETIEALLNLLILGFLKIKIRDDYLPLKLAEEMLFKADHFKRAPSSLKKAMDLGLDERSLAEHYCDWCGKDMPRYFITPPNSGLFAMTHKPGELEESWKRTEIFINLIRENRINQMLKLQQ